MSDEHSPNLLMPLLMPAQASKHVTHNEALLRLDALVHLAVLDRDTTQPPAAPLEGQRHIVAVGADGGWAGQAGNIAVFATGGWDFLIPRAGWRAFVLAEGIEVIWHNGQWQSGAARPFSASQLGINASADGINRLAVAADAVLLSHAGGGHQLKINKAGPSETASLLYQSNWSGRAELGLSGTNNFALKVSADGSSWTEAFHSDAATGRITIAHGLTVNGTVTGTAVTQSSTDDTSGRLLKTGDRGIGAMHAPNTPGSGLLGNVRGGLYQTFQSNNPENRNVNGYLLSIGAGFDAGSQGFGYIHWERASGSMHPHFGSRSADGTSVNLERVTTFRNLLGTVSQSAGLPTGAAMQGNASSAAPTGGWTERLADGFQTIHHAMTSSDGADTVWTYNSAFLTGSTPVIGIQPVGANLCAEVIARTATSCTFSIRDRTTGDRVAAPVDLIAHGRWSTLT